MTTKKKEEPTQTVQVARMTMGMVHLRIVGSTPLIQNKMSGKVKRGLLLGSKKKTAAERNEIKHHPFEEMLDATEVMMTGPTAIGLRTVALKAAMCTAALETGGIKKTQAQRLLFMPGEMAPVWGIPKLRMDVVRSADINRTPDVRTRPILERWCAEFDVKFARPALSAVDVINLLSNAGELIGVGDGRQEKGKFAFGSFRVLMDGDDDEEWNEIVAEGARDAQLAALNEPECYDSEARELLAFYEDEVNRRAA